MKVYMMGYTYDTLLGEESDDEEDDIDLQKRMLSLKIKETTQRGKNVKK